MQNSPLIPYEIPMEVIIVGCNVVYEVGTSMSKENLGSLNMEAVGPSEMLVLPNYMVPPALKTVILNLLSHFVDFIEFHYQTEIKQDLPGT
jgi:hypothetical protein